MTIDGRAKATLSFAVSGDTIESWESIEWTESYMDPLGSLRVRLRPLRKQVQDYFRQTVKGSPVKLFLDGAIQCKYLITTRQTTIGNEGVIIDIECKSVLVVPYEGSVNPNIAKKYGANVTISTVVQDALRDYGYKQLVATEESVDINIKAGGKVKNAVSKEQPVVVSKIKHKDIQPQPSETAYGFCSRIFSKYGLVLRASAFGELILSYPRYKDLSLYSIVAGPLKNVPSDADRAMGDVKISETTDNLFSEVVVSGRKVQNKKTKRTNQPSFRLKVDYDSNNSKSIEGRPDIAYQNSLTGFLENKYFHYQSVPDYRYKPKFVFDKSSQDKDRCKNMAFMVMYMNTSKGFTLDVLLDGIRSKTGNIWTINTMCDVRVALSPEQTTTESFQERMLVFKKTVRIDSSGQSTALTLIPEFSLRLGPRPGQS